jgi:hypothetical protein
MKCHNSSEGFAEAQNLLFEDFLRDPQVLQATTSFSQLGLIVTCERAIAGGSVLSKVS